MPTYNRDVSFFTKWIPIKTWLAQRPRSGRAPSSTVLACDQVNRHVNTQFIYQRDGLSDIWFTPDQFISAAGGDCEDFAIYKMHLLSGQGVDFSRMEMVICIDKFSREYHAVLRVFAGNFQYILDNQSALLMNKSSFNDRYTPIYAISMQGWRLSHD